MRPSVRPRGTRLSLDGFSWLLYCSLFQKYVGKDEYSLKFNKNNGTSHEDQHTFVSYLAQFFLEWIRMRNFSYKICRGNQNTILSSINFFLGKFCLFWANVEKYCGTVEATDGNIALAYCMLDTCGYKHTVRICNTDCFSAATMVARTRLIVTLHVHCLCHLSCWSYTLILR